MSKIELGSIPDVGSKRDAVHVAVAPVEAEVSFMPGERINISSNVARKVTARRVANAIVDPFLDREVQPTELFWCVIFPNTVQNLRHDWDHPSFPDETSEEYDDSCRGC